jgi:transposase
LRIHQELRRKGMTLMLLWEEHVAQHPRSKHLALLQFCENYRRYAKRLKRSMRQIHRAGEKLFIDFAGPTWSSPMAAVPTSSWRAGCIELHLRCATPRETMADWLHGCARALSFFGGVPQLIVPDNPKSHDRQPQPV